MGPCQQEWTCSIQGTQLILICHESLEDRLPEWMPRPRGEKGIPNDRREPTAPNGWIFNGMALRFPS
jgi:hypothetical protein